MHVVDNKFAVLHLPKTGGEWVEKILFDNFKQIYGHYHSFTHIPKDLPIFSFVRNPWAWYVSLYNFNFKESHHTIEFDEFIRLLNCPERKLEAIDFFRRDHAFPLIYMKTTEHWELNNKSYYGNKVELYTRHANIIGRTECIREHLISMLKSVDCLTPEIENRILTEPRVNVGKYSKPYQEFYTVETREIVEEYNQDVIQKYGYKFK